MEKTVNQWLDFLEMIPEIKKEKSDVEPFRKKLLKIKVDKKYKGYGGTVTVILPEKFKSLLAKCD